MPTAALTLAEASETPTIAPTLKLVTGASALTAGALETTWNAWTTGASYTTDSATVGDVWRIWISGTSAATTNVVINAGAWKSWNVNFPISTGGTSSVYGHAAQAAWTPEQVERVRREDEERRARVAVINKRAEELLYSVLDDEQRATYEKERYFDVYSGDRSRRYRIKKGWSGNVELIGPDGKAIERYCVHPREAVPEEDNLVAQMLMIEHEEQRFRATANITRLRAA